MGNSTRREFLEELIATQTVDPRPTNDQIFKKYANHSQPTGLQRTTSTLTPYNGAWTQAQVIALLRRTTFGIKPADIATLLAMTPGTAVDYLFSNAPTAAPAPPVNNYYTNYTDPTGIAAGATWVNAAYGDGTVNGKRKLSLKSWWMGLLLNQNLSILEKMTWFWHNHFATEITTVGDARLCYIHHSMLRANALGNFKTLTTKVTTDPAMLVYLSGDANVASAPDENYGRELQELFTVSKYNTPSYTEDDVKAASHTLTGWQIDMSTTPITSKFTPSRHDATNKLFGPFYNNTVITGQSGANGANEITALMNMIFGVTAQQTANWICTKLYRYFVYYTIDTQVQTDIITPLANLLISNSWNIVPVVKALLKSQHFFDVNNFGCYIRTPLDYLVGTFRTFGVTLPNTFDAAKTYAVWSYVRQYGADNGLELGEPPNVAGFPAYYQDPEFYELWINSNTYPHRLEFTDMMLGAGFTASTGTAIKIDVLAFTSAYANAADPDMLTEYYCDLLLGVDISAAQKTSLKQSILLSGQTTNGYWTTAWQTYVATPNTANANIVKTRITNLLLAITHLEEHQLC